MLQAEPWGVKRRTSELVLLLAIEARQMFCRALVGRRGEDVLCSNVPKSTIVCPCVKTAIAPNLLGRPASLCRRRELTEDDQTLSPFQQGKQDTRSRSRARRVRYINLRAGPSRYTNSSVEEEKRDLDRPRVLARSRSSEEELVLHYLGNRPK
jgi:hypothetical protein